MSQWQPEYDPRQARRDTPPSVPPQSGQYGMQPQQYQQPQYPQQVQPYGQWQQRPYWQQGQPAPVVAPKSTATGLILGLLIPGTGCMYAGQTGVGILILAGWLLSVPLIAFAFIGVATGFIFWIAGAVLGYTMTRDWNRAHGIVS